MSKNTKISFIPKKPIIASQSKHGHKPISLLLALATLSWVVIFACYATFYFYRTSLEKTVDAKTVALEEKKSALESTDIIAKARNLEKDIANINFVLDKHVVFTPIFSFLEKAIAKDVQLTDITFTGMAAGGTVSGSNAGSSGVNISLKGVTLDYASLAAQLDALKEQHDTIKNYALEKFSLDDFGNVDFELTIEFRPDYLLYTGQLERSSGDPITDTATTTGE